MVFRSKAKWLGFLAVVLVVLATGLSAACGGDGNSLTIYSGREKNLLDPIVEQFQDASGVEVGVKYGTNAGLVATIREEGSNSPADLFFGTDPAYWVRCRTCSRFSRIVFWTRCPSGCAPGKVNG